MVHIFNGNFNSSFNNAVVVLNLYSECPRGHPYFVGEVKIILTIAINL